MTVGRRDILTQAILNNHIGNALHSHQGITNDALFYGNGITRPNASNMRPTPITARGGSVAPGFSAQGNDRIDKDNFNANSI